MSLATCKLAVATGMALIELHATIDNRQSRKALLGSNEMQILQMENIIIF
jgi:hypothetical protein